MIKLIFSLILITISSQKLYGDAGSEKNQAILDPDIISVYSSPIEWGQSEGIRYRLIVYLSEIYLSLHIQKLKYGEENCCVTVSENIPIQLRRGVNIFTITEVDWVNQDAVKIKFNSGSSIIVNLKDKSYILKEKDKNEHGIPSEPEHRP